MKALKIISGGQTGVDRAALDVARKHGIESGGWCPAGRLDEFGRIPDHYPVQELEAGGFTQRTLQNVKDSDGTIIIYAGELGGGTEQTARFCVELGRPHQLVDASKITAQDAGNSIADFVRAKQIGILNVAGPRQSEWPEGYDWAFRVLTRCLNLITSKSTSRSKDRIIRSAALLRDRAAPRSTRESARRMNRLGRR